MGPEKGREGRWIDKAGKIFSLRIFPPPPPPQHTFLLPIRILNKLDDFGIQLALLLLSRIEKRSATWDWSGALQRRNKILFHALSSTSSCSSCWARQQSLRFHPHQSQSDPMSPDDGSSGVVALKSRPRSQRPTMP
uniref:Uncharacterized protein n=1 Tax=Peronospora matthiolae TaxID=2874970 RepID=A0AAV1T965_9STRA